MAKKSVYYVIEANSGEYYGGCQYDDLYFVLCIGCAKKFYAEISAKDRLIALKELYPDSFDKGKVKKVVIKYKNIHYK